MVKFSELLWNERLVEGGNSLFMFFFLSFVFICFKVFKISIDLRSDGFIFFFVGFWSLYMDIFKIDCFWFFFNFILFDLCLIFIFFLSFIRNEILKIILI